MCWDSPFKYALGLLDLPFVSNNVSQCASLRFRKYDMTRAEIKVMDLTLFSAGIMLQFSYISLKYFSSLFTFLYGVGFILHKNLD